MDNSPDPPSQNRVSHEVRSADAEARSVAATLVTPGENLGLARGVNLGTRIALEQGYSAVLLLDHDSVLDHGTAAALRSEYGRRSREGDACLLSAENMLAGSTFAHRLLESFFYRYGNGGEESRRCPLAITSGMLLHERVLRRTGLFDESMFLDNADHEFVLRARRLGVHVRLAASARIRHSLGQPSDGAARFFGQPIRYDSEPRLYLGVRDNVRVARRYGSRYPLLTTALLSTAALRTLAYRQRASDPRLYRAALHGWADGLRSKEAPRIPHLP